MGRMALKHMQTSYKTLILYMMHSQMDQTTLPRKHQFICGNQIYDRGVIVDHQRDELFNKLYWDKKLNLYPYLIKAQKQFQMNYGFTFKYKFGKYDTENGRIF